MADSTIGQPYTRDFQVRLLAQLYADDKFFKDNHGILRLSDFDLPVCQFLYEALQDCRALCGGRRPEPSLFAVHAELMLKSGKAKTMISPEEYEALATVMQGMFTTATITAAVTEYMKASLPAYLKQIRTLQAVDAHRSNLSMGQGADELIQAVLSINQDVATHSDIKVEGMLDTPYASLDLTRQRRISTGLLPLNYALDGGLGIGETGMITACPGVGKTTTLINFLNGAVRSGKRGLFVTLEMSKPRIDRRYYSIAAGIDARYLKIDHGRWPESVRRQFAQFAGPDNRFLDYPSIVDGSARKLTIADIEKAIGNWKDFYVARYGEAKAACLAVYIDWLDLISTTGLSGITKQTREDTLLAKLCEALALLARKFGVCLWHATQGTRNADGKEVVKMKDTAFGYHKNDAVDVGLGIGVIDADASVDSNSLFSDDTLVDKEGPITSIDSIGKPCSRFLKGTIFKSRDNPFSVVEIYQGRTLKFYSNPADEQPNGTSSTPWHDVSREAEGHTAITGRQQDRVGQNK